MTAFSLGTIWEETIAFLRRESGLLIPVALITYGPAHLLINYSIEATAAMREGVDKAPDMRMLLIFPGLLAYLFGNLTIASMALTPGISVREALSRAGGRLLTALGAMFLMGLGLIAVIAVIAIIVALCAIVFRVDPRSPAVSRQLVFLLMIPMTIVATRMMPLIPVVAKEGTGPLEAVRRSWALGKNSMLRLFGVFVLAGFLGVIIGLIEQFVIGAVFQLVGLATGASPVVGAIQMLVNATIDSILSLGVAVYVALIYRRLASG